MINRVTGEISFESGLRIVPHCAFQLLPGKTEKMRTVEMSLKGWKRHILGHQTSEHGTFEVDALSQEEGRILVALLSHQHAFYEPSTPNDAERRAFHEGVINADLAGQKEFKWGEVLCRLDAPRNTDWLVVAYSRSAKVPLQAREVLLRLYAHEKT